MAIPSLMLVMSGIMKLIRNPTLVEHMEQGGLGGYIAFFGIIELVSVALFVYPRTSRTGFLLLCCYLGGALATELANAQPPTAAILLALLWTSVFLHNRTMFLEPAKPQE